MHMTTEEALEAIRKGTYTLAPGPQDDPYPKLYQRFILVRVAPSDPCLKCGAELRGEPIPEHKQLMFGTTHFSRCISIYDRERDRTVGYKCLDCGHEWPRAC